MIPTISRRPRRVTASGIQIGMSSGPPTTVGRRRYQPPQAKATTRALQDPKPHRKTPQCERRRGAAATYLAGCTSFMIASATSPALEPMTRRRKITTTRTATTRNPKRRRRGTAARDGRRLRPPSFRSAFGRRHVAAPSECATKVDDTFHHRGPDPPADADDIFPWKPRGQAEESKSLRRAPAGAGRIGRPGFVKKTRRRRCFVWKNWELERGSTATGVLPGRWSGKINLVAKAARRELGVIMSCSGSRASRPVPASSVEVCSTAPLEDVRRGRSRELAQLQDEREDVGADPVHLLREAHGLLLTGGMGLRQLGGEQTDPRRGKPPAQPERGLGPPFAQNEVKTITYQRAPRSAKIDLLGVGSAGRAQWCQRPRDIVQ